MDLLIADNLWHNHVSGERFLCFFLHDGDRVTILIDFGFGLLIVLSYLLLEKVVSYASTVRKNLVDYETVLGICEAVLDLGCGLTVEMGSIIVSFTDLVHWRNHLTDIDSGCFSALL